MIDILNIILVVVCIGISVTTLFYFFFILLRFLVTYVLLKNIKDRVHQNRFFSLFAWIIDDMAFRARRAFLVACAVFFVSIFLFDVLILVCIHLVSTHV